MNLWMLVYAVGAAQGLMLAIALLQRQGRTAADRLLAGWMLLVAVDLAVRVWAMADPGVHTFKPMRVVSLFPFLHGSLFYLYVRSVIRGRGLGWGDMRHAFGFLIALLLIVDLLWVPPGELEAIIVDYWSGAFQGRQLAVNLGLFGWSLSYVGAAVLAIYRYRRRLLATRSDGHPGVLGWLMVMAACQCVIWVIALGQWLLPVDWLPYRMIYVAVAAWVLLVGYLSLLRPREPVAGEDPQSSAGDPESPDEASPVEEDPRFDEVEARLRQLMEAQQIFREPALSMAALARRSGYPEYLVSAVINRRFGCPFWDYVNRHRVDAARACLQNPNDRRTALDIAYDCGFTSKSTFNAAFKRLLGRTPSALRRQTGIGSDPGGAGGFRPAED